MTISSDENRSPLDEAYLAEMQGYLGSQALGDLLATAPASFRPLVAEIESCWRRGALDEFRETAHRLAGAAASIGARRLADAARRCQGIPAEELNDQAIVDLAATSEEALAALRAYFPD